MEIIEVLKVETLPLADEISVDVYVTALIDFGNDPEIVETSFEYCPSEWPQDEPIKDYSSRLSMRLSEPLSEEQLKVLKQWLEALRSDQNDWYSPD